MQELNGISPNYEDKREEKEEIIGGISLGKQEKIIRQTSFIGIY